MMEVLDATCAGRQMWFDKDHPDVLFVDKRIAPPGSIIQQPLWEIAPTVVVDYEGLPFADNSFEMVVFDPPHADINPGSIIGTKYGTLTDLEETAAGLGECWRVAQRWLVFKWAESEFTIGQVLDRVPFRPLFGHTTAKSGPTIWAIFKKGRPMGIGDGE